MLFCKDIFGQKEKESVEVLVILEKNPKRVLLWVFFLKRRSKDNCVKQQGATE